METEILDLWPPDIGGTQLRTPISILRTQAALLGKKTKNLIEGEVQTRSQANLFVHNFFLVAPGLDSYRYRLFSLSHSVLLYPVNVLYLLENQGPNRRLETEDVLIEFLKEVFSLEETRRIINVLLAQVTEPGVEVEVAS